MDSSSGNSNSNSNLLLSDLLYSWDSNNDSNNEISSNSSSSLYDTTSLLLSSSSVNNSQIMLDDNSLLFLDPMMNTMEPYFTPYNEDNSFFDLFPQQYINNNSSSSLISTPILYEELPASPTMVLPQYPFMIEKPTSFMTLDNNNHYQENDPTTTIQNEVMIQEKKKVKRKRKKRKVVDVDPNAPPKPKRITGLNKPLILSPSLQTIMEGATELSRPEIVKRLWNYIKLNHLQDPADRRFILCDEKLKRIFQKDRVNSFGMNRDLTAHLTKKQENVQDLPSSVVEEEQDLFSSVIKEEEQDIFTSPIPNNDMMFLLQ